VVPARYGRQANRLTHPRWRGVEFELGRRKHVAVARSTALTHATGWNAPGRLGVIWSSLTGN
jgi:hypothetical protein